MSLGETLLKALMDTLMGMGSVFLILILICIIISLFKFIPKPEAQGAGNPAPVKEEVKDESEDDEITAVIMAAIRMHLERDGALKGGPERADNAPGYIVRSVRRRK